jgi:hypothetical protein
MNVKDALEKISEMTNVNDILIFIAGDERKTVIDAAEKNIAELRSPKQGEQAASDFKEGGQATKDADPLNPVPIESLHPRTYITCEDVLKRLRAEGVKI